MFLSMSVWADSELLRARAPAVSESTPWLLGCVIFFCTCAVWGITNIQLFLYFLRHVNDPWKLKLLASSIWILDSLHQALVTFRNPIIPIGSNFSPFIIQDTVFNTLPFIPLAIVSTFAQGFFAYQCGKVSKSHYLIPACAAPLILFQFVLPITLLKDVHRLIYNYENQSADTTAAWLTGISGILRLHNQLLVATAAIGASLNIITTTWLISFLWRGYVQNGSVFNRPRPLFYRVFLLFVNTGLCTAIYSVLTIFMISYTRVVYDLFGVYVKLLAPLYTSTVLANLNAREYLRDQGDHVLLPITSEKEPPSGDEPIRFQAEGTVETEF